MIQTDLPHRHDVFLLHPGLQYVEILVPCPRYIQWVNSIGRSALALRAAQTRHGGKIGALDSGDDNSADTRCRGTQQHGIPIYIELGSIQMAVGIYQHHQDRLSPTIAQRPGSPAARR